MSLSRELVCYLDWLANQKSYSPSTVTQARYNLSLFVSFASALGVVEPGEIDRELLQDWSEQLAWRVGLEGRPIRTVTRSGHLSVLRGFLKFLFEKDLTLTDLSGRLVRPKCPRKLPGVVLEQAEVERMIGTADKGGVLGLRDRVILEVLYSSALRASELGRLKVEEVDHESGLVFVREGKGGKDRVVPLGRIASELIRTYLVAARRELLRGPDPGTLLLNLRGRPMRKWSILRVVKDNARQAAIAKKTTTHAFRRTCATLMLRDGANIRVVQEILGHESIQTTALYLRVAAREIKTEHEKHHPREKGNGRAPAEGAENGARLEPDVPHEKTIRGPVTIVSTPVPRGGLPGGERGDRIEAAGDARRAIVAPRPAPGWRGKRRGRKKGRRAPEPRSTPTRQGKRGRGRAWKIAR